jgi:hypothetical protein
MMCSKFCCRPRKPIPDRAAGAAMRVALKAGGSVRFGEIRRSARRHFDVDRSQGAIVPAGDVPGPQGDVAERGADGQPHGYVFIAEDDSKAGFASPRKMM